MISRWHKIATLEHNELIRCDTHNPEACFAIISSQSVIQIMDIINRPNYRPNTITHYKISFSDKLHGRNQ